MEQQNRDLYEVAITAIIIKDGKYLITRRSANKKRWPGMWTVPGGRLDPSDYESLPKDAANAWYNVLERTVKREVKEETNLDIKNIEYVTSIIADHGDARSLIVSVVADYDSGDIKLQEEETDKYAWVTLEEAKTYDLIDGILDELIMTEQKKKGEKTEWQRFSDEKTRQ